MASPPRIFLSHAHADRELVDDLCDLLCVGIPELQLDHLFCTSLDGQGIAPGATSVNEIHAALTSSSLALFLITPAFEASRFCLSEAGAAWGCGRPFIPIVVSPATHHTVPAVLQSAQVGRIDSMPSLSALRDRIADALGRGKSNDAVWDRKRRAFLDNHESRPLLHARPGRKFDFPRALASAPARVRLSVAALVDIRLDGKSLLVRGSRYPDQFQPVGGVLKYLDSAREVLVGLGMTFDELVPNDGDSRYDLRRYFPASNVDAFVDWFDSRQGRELGPWREFHEELIEPGILDRTAFPHARFEFLRTAYTGIRWSNRINGWELLIAELFRLDPTAEQSTSLGKLMSRTDDRIAWAEDTDFANGSVSQSKNTPPTRISEASRLFLQ